MTTSAKTDNDPGRGWKAKFTSLKERYSGSHVARTLDQYGNSGGNVLSGGIAYFSLTSLAAGLVILATITSYFIGQDEQAQQSILDFLDEAIPGIVSNGSEDGLVDEGSLEPSSISGVVGAVAFLVLFFTATRYIGGLRQGVKVMLGNEVATGVTGKLRDFLVLAVIAVMLLLGVALQVLASQASGLFADVIGEEGLSQWVLRGPAYFVTLVVDSIFVFIAIKVLGRAQQPLRDMWRTLLLVAVLMSLLRLGSTFIISGASENPVLGPFAAVITILIFADFVARFILFGAAWLGTDEKSQVDVPHPEKAEGEVDEAGGPAATSTSSTS